jgi:hypothetical protein
MLVDLHRSIAVPDWLQLSLEAEFTCFTVEAVPIDTMCSFFFRVNIFRNVKFLQLKQI